jgi:hypothetical protein
MSRKLAIAFPAVMAAALPVVITIATSSQHVADVAGIRGP